MTSDRPLNFDQLIEQYSSLLKRVAATYEANASKQQDLFQEICLAVWLAMPAYKGSSTVKTYILRIAHNVSVKHVAKEVKSVSHTVQLDIEEQPIPTLDSHEGDKRYQQEQQSAKLMYHLRKLPLLHRQLFALLMEGLSYKDIAEITGNSVANVGVMIMRIKKQLSEAMSNE